MKTSNHN